MIWRGRGGVRGDSVAGCDDVAGHRRAVRFLRRCRCRTVRRVVAVRSSAPWPPWTTVTGSSPEAAHGGEVGRDVGSIELRPAAVRRRRRHRRTARPSPSPTTRCSRGVVAREGGKPRKRGPAEIDDVALAEAPASRPPQVPASMVVAGRPRPAARRRRAAPRPLRSRRPCRARALEVRTRRGRSCTRAGAASSPASAAWMARWSNLRASRRRDPHGR